MFNLCVFSYKYDLKSIFMINLDSKLLKILNIFTFLQFDYQQFETQRGKRENLKY